MLRELIIYKGSLYTILGMGQKTNTRDTNEKKRCSWSAQLVIWKAGYILFSHITTQGSVILVYFEDVVSYDCIAG